MTTHLCLPGHIPGSTDLAGTWCGGISDTVAADWTDCPACQTCHDSDEATPLVALRPYIDGKTRWVNVERIPYETMIWRRAYEMSVEEATAKLQELLDRRPPPVPMYLGPEPTFTLEHDEPVDRPPDIEPIDVTMMKALRDDMESPGDWVTVREFRTRRAIFAAFAHDDRPPDTLYKRTPVASVNRPRRWWHRWFGRRP